MRRTGGMRVKKKELANCVERLQGMLREERRIRQEQIEAFEKSQRKASGELYDRIEARVTDMLKRADTDDIGVLNSNEDRVEMRAFIVEVLYSIMNEAFLDTNN